MAYVEVFKEQRKVLNAWRWRRKSGNHQIVASSGEGFTRRSSAKRAAHKSFPDDDIKVIG